MTKTGQRLADLDAREEEIWSLIEDGKSLAEVAKTINCSRQFLSKWLRWTSEREKRYNKCRAQAADMLIDDIIYGDEITLERAMQGKASKTEVAAAKLRSDNKRWLAGRWNPKYAENQNNVSVNVDLGSLFLSAMRKPIQELTVEEPKLAAPTEANRLPVVEPVVETKPEPVDTAYKPDTDEVDDIDLDAAMERSRSGTERE